MYNCALSRIMSVLHFFYFINKLPRFVLLRTFGIAYFCIISVYHIPGYMLTWFVIYLRQVNMKFSLRVLSD